VDVIVFGNPEGNLGARFFDGSAHRDVDAPLEFANVVGVVLEAGAIARAEASVKHSQFLGDGIEDARVLFASLQAFLGVCAVTKQTLERNSRIDFRWKRSGGVRP